MPKNNRVKQVKAKYKSWTKFFKVITIEYFEESTRSWKMAVDNGHFVLPMTFTPKQFFEDFIFKNEPDWVKEKREKYNRPKVIRDIIE